MLTFSSHIKICNSLTAQWLPRTVTITTILWYELGYSHPFSSLVGLSVSSPGLLWRIRPEIRSSSSNDHRLPALLCRLVRRQSFPACVFSSYILCIYILLHIVIINIIKYIVCDIDYLLPFKLGYTTVNLLARCA